MFLAREALTDCSPSKLHTLFFNSEYRRCRLKKKYAFVDAAGPSFAAVREERESNGES